MCIRDSRKRLFLLRASVARVRSPLEHLGLRQRPFLYYQSPPQSDTFLRQRQRQRVVLDARLHAVIVNFLDQVKNVAINLMNEGKQKAKGSYDDKSGLLEAKGSYGDESYTLKITKEAVINDKSKCFLAEFESVNDKKLFSICKSGENSSILEVTQ